MIMLPLLFGLYVRSVLAVDENVQAGFALPAHIVPILDNMPGKTSTDEPGTTTREPPPSLLKSGQSTFDGPLPMSAYRYWAPHISVALEASCNLHPVVSSDGKLNTGIDYDKTKPREQHGHLCFRRYAEQIYVRGAPWEDAYAIMYTAYFPQEWDQHFTGYANGFGTIIVWLQYDTSEDPPVMTPYWLTYIFEGEFRGTSLDPSQFPLKIWREHNTFSPSSFVAFATGEFRELPLVDWDTLSPAAKKALNEHNFTPQDQATYATQTCHFNDNNFEKILGTWYHQPPAATQWEDDWGGSGYWGGDSGYYDGGTEYPADEP